MRTSTPHSRPTAPLRFEGGLGILGGFAAFMAVFLAGWTASVSPTVQRLFGLSPDEPWHVLLNVLPGVLMLGVGSAVLRLEGIRRRDVGLSWDHARTALVWFGGIVVGLNVLLLLVAVVTEGHLSWSYADLTLALVVVFLVVDWVFVGIAEEFVARAYVQNKFVALLGGGRTRSRKALAILAGAVLFSLWHVPQRLLVGGVGPSQLPGNLLVLLVGGLAFGVLYEATRNVVLVGLLHGAYNFAPIVVNVRYADRGSASLQFLLLVALLAPVVVGVWAYYRWARSNRASDFRPPVTA